jgi:hypothetical protein
MVNASQTMQQQNHKHRTQNTPCTARGRVGSSGHGEPVHATKAANLDNTDLLQAEGGVCLGATPCGSQAYPYLLLLQVIHVLWLKVDGDDQRYLEPRFAR